MYTAIKDSKDPKAIWFNKDLYTLIKVFKVTIELWIKQFKSSITRFHYKHCFLKLMWMKFNLLNWIAKYNSEKNEKFGFYNLQWDKKNTYFS